MSPIYGNCIPPLAQAQGAFGLAFAVLLGLLIFGVMVCMDDKWEKRPHQTGVLILFFGLLLVMNTIGMIILNVPCPFTYNMAPYQNTDLEIPDALEYGLFAVFLAVLGLAFSLGFLCVFATERYKDKQ